MFSPFPRFNSGVDQEPPRPPTDLAPMTNQRIPKRRLQSRDLRASTASLPVSPTSISPSSVTGHRQKGGQEDKKLPAPSLPPLSQGIAGEARQSRRAVCVRVLWLLAVRLTCECGSADELVLFGTIFVRFQFLRQHARLQNLSSLRTCSSPANG